MDKQRQQIQIHGSLVDNPSPPKALCTDCFKTFVTFPLSLVTKEIALPGEVQDSLLSQSCGAKEIVLKLKENMQLEQASLEEPDSETKALIRCLARKSKDSNRLDVFQHLREITPAGTTGEFVISEVRLTERHLHL